MLEEQIQLFLSQISKNPILHGRFLNTLSLLEYIGARKIGKSQPEEHISLQLLAHWAEEIRHAQMFKKCALQITSGMLTDYRDNFLWCGPQARQYIQAIDHGVESLLKAHHPWMNYLYATLLIEERANQVYALYEPILSPLGLGGFLRAILREEKTHLDQMVAALTTEASLTHTKNDELLLKMRQKETVAFESFLGAMLSQLKTESLGIQDIQKSKQALYAND